ncbi:MAG: hypothetical protein ACXVPU_05085 [Bacteroidia bacterium]
MSYSKIIFTLSIVISICFSSCQKEKQTSSVPHIEFLSYKKYSNDSADCIISFTDGDGDIGIESSDLISENDMFMKYLYKDTLDGIFKPFDSVDSTFVMDTLFYSYRIPYLKNEGQNKSLQGTIKAKLRALPIYQPQHKTVKFEIRIKDRAGNYSNIVSTNEISTSP